MKPRKPAQGTQASSIAVVGEFVIGGSKHDHTNDLRAVMLRGLGEQLVIFVERGLDG